MSVLRVAIADDEPLARERIRSMLAKHAGYVVVAECADGPAAVEALLEHRPDLLFLDVRMPGLDGFDVLAALEDAPVEPAVVFVTAFDAHAVRAFEVGAIDYLLKPFDAERFARALERAEERIVRGDTAGADSSLRALLAGIRPAGYPERFLVRGAGHLYFVPAADVEWVDNAANYVRLHAGGRTHLVRDTLTAFGARLPPDRFVRVHRSVIVNLDYIQRLQPRGHGEYLITMRDGTRVASSRTHGARLQHLLR